MSYTKTIWQDGDVITAEKLNNIESGVESANSSGSILVVRANDRILNKTWQEIYSAITNMTPVYLYKESNVLHSLEPIIDVTIDDNKYYVNSIGSSYNANSSSDYPVMNEPE